jgi:hypothetical protein
MKGQQNSIFANFEKKDHILEKKIFKGDKMEKNIAPNVLYFLHDVPGPPISPS